MSSRTGIVVVLLLGLAAVPAATAGGATKVKPTVDRSILLWATVNVCDPVNPPKKLRIGDDTIGIRGSMPGAADGREDMYMRFRVQFFKDADMKWHNVTQGGDSGWRNVGKAVWESRQGGRYFRFSPPPGKASVLLRGKINYEWRLKDNVVRTAVKVTAKLVKGQRAKAGTYPPGYSEAQCTITA
jgi:hypothetical protein